MREGQAALVREAFDETAYLAALQTLGLVPPVDRADIHRAYRNRAKRIHPDRFQDETEKAQATRRIQEINAAHSYAVQHWHGFQLTRRWQGSKPAARAAEAPPWHEWAFLPVTAVYALTTIASAAPVVALARLVGPERRARWREGRLASLLWQLWLVVAPHGVTLVLFASADGLAVRAWFGTSFLIMLSADIATLVTGDANALRRPLSSALVRLP